MEINPDPKLKSFLFPLPIFSSTYIGEALSKDGEKFSVFAGLDEKLILQLKELSLDETDEELQKNTSDFKRFGVGKYEDWYKKNRIPFALVHTASNSLAALVWFGPKPIGRKSLKHLSNAELSENESDMNKENWHTISYRCYPNFRGKGLTKKFVAFCMDIYIKNVPNVRLWAGINTENSASSALALSLGFKLIDDFSDINNNWAVMVKD
ncbi:MAG: GNAT family N-acetyltransferase [Candidatus Paceibacterota bacterium]